MKTRIKIVVAGAFALAAVTLIGSQDASAAISGRCDDCHTMHNSQDGQAMTSGTLTAQNALLRYANGCIGCHTGPNGTSAINADSKAPLVLHDSVPGYVTNNSYLAGGSFYFTENLGDEYGHNVQGMPLNPVDNTGTFATVPPGGVANDLVSGPLGCAQGGGETGCHWGGGHHTNVGGDYANKSTTVWVGGESVGQSYRFLSGGTKGGEDGDWEYTNATTDHNLYLSSGSHIDGSDGSITAVCIRCHGNFHGSVQGSGDGVNAVAGAGATSPWIRHPTDLSMNKSGVSPEHQSYHSYSMITPIGIGTSLGDSSYGNVTAGDYIQAVDDTFDFVLCQSCHRAHASPYMDMLRFSYTDMDAGGGGTTGCLKCHSQKR